MINVRSIASSLVNVAPKSTHTHTHTVHQEQKKCTLPWPSSCAWSAPILSPKDTYDVSLDLRAAAMFGAFSTPTYSPPSRTSHIWIAMSFATRTLEREEQKRQKNERPCRKTTGANHARPKQTAIHFSG